MLVEVGTAAWCQKSDRRRRSACCHERRRAGEQDGASYWQAKRPALKKLASIKRSRAQCFICASNHGTADA
eukprot:scaffold33525_cov118-Isochrysis_galbana.AAC.1